MEFTSVIPRSAPRYKISAVYKITFDTGHFYIGCSEFLQSRASSWGSILTKKTRTEYDFLDQVIDAKSAKLEVVELCDKCEVLDREAFYLNKHSGNPMMLSKERCAWKPVLQYNKNGQFVKKHVSVGAAARYNSTKVGKIQEVLSGVRASHKEMKFIYELDYHREKPNKKRSELFERKKGRDIIAYDADGVEVRFKMITKAAAYIGCSRETVLRALSGIQKAAKGYVLKYAEY